MMPTISTSIYNCLSRLCFVVIFACSSKHSQWFLICGFHFFSFLLNLHGLIRIPEIPESYLCFSFTSTAAGLAVMASGRLSPSLVMLAVIWSTAAEHREMEFLVSVSVTVFCFTIWSKWPHAHPTAWRAGRLTCVWTLYVDVSGMISPPRNHVSCLHSFVCHWDTQGTPPRKRTSLSGITPIARWVMFGMLLIKNCTFNKDCNHDEIETRAIKHVHFQTYGITE